MTCDQPGQFTGSRSGQSLVSTSARPKLLATSARETVLLQKSLQALQRLLDLGVLGVGSTYKQTQSQPPEQCDARTQGR
ncbi:MAG: hypothetical protein NTY67_10905 [Cyanobacteria bacterium]|nr:hypothetical protein [Cyanobacteriota bacterium]